MKRHFIVVIVSALIAVALPANAAAHSTDLGSCLKMDRRTTISSNSIIGGLGLTPDQKREMRARIDGGHYQLAGSFDFQGFDGLGLTASQIAAMTARIRAHIRKDFAHPLGWPCVPFASPKRVVGWMREDLASDGFSPGAKFFISPRQISFSAIKDGVPFSGAIAKTGPRSVEVQLFSPQWPFASGPLYHLDLAFVT